MQHRASTWVLLEFRDRSHRWPPRKHPLLVLACLSSSSCAGELPGAAPRAWPLIVQSKALIVFWNSLWEWLPDDQQGLELGLKLELCSLTHAMVPWVVEVLSAPKPQNKVQFSLCLWSLILSLFLFRMPKLRTRLQQSVTRHFENSLFAWEICFGKGVDCGSQTFQLLVISVASCLLHIYC